MNRSTQYKQSSEESKLTERMRYSNRERGTEINKVKETMQTIEIEGDRMTKTERDRSIGRWIDR